MQNSIPSRPLVTLHDVQVSLSGTLILRGISWSLNTGENWVIRGANGSGKSTLLKLIAGRLWPTPGQHKRRLYHFSEELEWSPVSATAFIALLSPDLQNRYLHQDWDLTAGEVMATGFLQTDLLHEEPTPDDYRRLNKVVARFGLAELYPRPFLELSQGERRKVLIARALLARPKVLLLDEFSEGLDRKANEEFHRLLCQIAEEGVTVVLSTHRPPPEALRDWREMHLEAGRIVKVEAGKTGSLAIKPPFVEGEPSTHESGERLIRIRNGQFFLAGQRLLRDIDWDLIRGRHVAILGPNGSGKTSFLRLLWGEQHLALGGELVRFEEPGGLTSQDIRGRTAFFHPDLHALFDPDELVEDIIVSGLFSSIGLTDPVTVEQRNEAAETARLFHVDEFIGRSLKSLSYGQARRVLMARTLIAKPQLLLLDEPFDGLDLAARHHIATQLRQAADEGATLVLTCHHSEDLPEWVTHALRIEQQRLVSLRRIE